MKINRLGVRGFTITELLVVTIVIAVLASLTFILYTGVQTKLIDASISADAESMNSSELLYKLSHNSIAKAYYSGNGPDSELNFSPKTGNIIDVVISGKEFCIRVYNPKGTKNSIYNAYQVESRLGLCYELPPSYDAASAATPSVPDAPNITVALDGSNIVATIAPVTCAVGTVQYGINSRTNDGAWTGFTDWSEVITASQAVSEGVKYGYQAQARCYISVTAVYGDAAVGIENTYTHLFAPSAPNITVAQNGGNIDATIIPVSCTVGTVQYEINNRIDNGAWSGYTTWSIDTTATQVATGGEGVKYSYQAQARCYVGNNELSPIATGPEGNYISPITTPSNPIVSASTTAGYVTTYSWGAASCASGTTARYQYRFIITPSGYDSDWVAIGGTSIDFSTSTGGETYDLQVQAQCYNDNASSSWSGSGSASYFCVGDANPIATSISGYWSTAPSGYLLEDGSAISRTTYADLFTAIGTTYGAGDGSTTFNLPDSRGRVAVNKNSTDTEFDTLGEKYGEKSHTLTGAESGEKGHNHLQDAHSHGISDPSHRHTAAGGNFSTPSGSFYGLATSTNQYTGYSATGITINNAIATNIAASASNASSAHNTIQPSIVKTFAIKYRPATVSDSMLSEATSISGYWTSVPSGYLSEDGSAVSRATYSDLFAAIGTTYGAGDGSTTFNLPDSRGRVVVNKNPSDIEFDTMGEKYGEKSHTNTVTESGLKGHNHTQNAHNHSINDPGHSHTAAGANFYTPSGSFYGLATSTNQYTGYSATGITINNAIATNIAASASNASSAHNTIQPSIVKLSVIKYTIAAGSVDATAKGTSVQGYWSTAPSGYLLEDGSAISRTTYADLFTAIGTTYGAGDGSTTFNLPDSRGRVAVNKNSTDTEFDTLGEKYGEKSHTLTGAESGEKGHNHAQDAHSHGISDPSHRHTAAGGNFSTPSGSFYGLATAGQSTGSSATGITINNATATNQAIASSNASSAHNNIQPSIVENFAIRY